MDENNLEFIFNNINDWLKYAETKNGVLLTLLIAIIGVIVDKDIPSQIKFALMTTCIISILILLISFAPILNFFCKDSKKNKEFNVLYFGNLKDIDKQYFIKKVYNKEEISKYENDIIEQIIINSEIAYRKYIIFNTSTIILLIGIIVSLILLAI